MPVSLSRCRTPRLSVASLSQPAAAARASSGAVRRVHQSPASRRSLPQHNEQESLAWKSLILEILNAQPSLRDSKTYLNSFAPKRGGAPAASTSKLPPNFLAPKHAIPNSSISLPSNLQLPPAAPPLPVEPLASIKDSHAFRPLDVVPPQPQPQQAQEGVLTEPAKDGTEAALQPELAPSPMQQHTALVKVQGPFTDRQLESIADGMAYLKKLGLVSIIVVDSEETSWKHSVASFSPVDGRCVQVEAAQAEEADEDLARWLSAKPAGSPSVRKLGRGQEALRKRMTSEVHKLSELLSQRGAPARPFPQAVMRVDAQAVAQDHSSAPPHYPDRAPRSSARASSSTSCWASYTAHQGTGGTTAASVSGLAAVPSRSPLVSDDKLISLRSALASDQIPVLAPVALYEDPDESGAERTVCVSADDVLVGLARDMAKEGRRAELEAQQGLMPADGVDMMPLRLMVINREGGIPSHARGGNPHLSINLASEASHIVDHFIWQRSHPTALSNLAMVQDCLSYMPHTSSGVVVSHRSPRSLIANLITNKAAHSPSLPHRLLASRKDVRHTPTIIRPGLDVRVISDFAQVDQAKMTALLEASFGRKLDAQNYYARLERSCDFVIVTGDYQGAAIVTHEYAPEDVRGVDEPIAYLDKFAVLPVLQGSGTVDFLWGALRDEVHGLGLLDALNDNGGKGGFGQGRDLVWKSRADNPVNRWYYERSNGFARIDTRTDAERAAEGWKPAWSMFWCDAEDRISRMAGERRLGAEASQEDVMDYEEEQRSASSLTASRRRAAAARRSTSYREDDDEALDYASASPLTRPRDPSTGRLLSELDPRPGGGAGTKLLPIVAPDEAGRLERWARCMGTIKTAWL